MEIASEVIGWDDLVKTFEKVTGLKAVYKRLDINEWSVFTSFVFLSLSIF